MDLDSFNSYLRQVEVLEGDLARPRSGKQLLSGPTVVPPGATVSLRQGTGLHHGGLAGKSTTTNSGNSVCYRLREPPKVVVQGPATAVQVLEAFTKAVRWECARNLRLGELLESGRFPADQAQRYLAGSCGRSYPVLDLQPDPLADPDSAAAKRAVQKWDQAGFDAGSTALEYFERVTTGTSGATEEEFEAKWSEPFC
ncbi:hypothetical protein JKP88DRAFT_252850 [Tribonema minus]|uniref:Uncharacterized protein n=1 Tax=Tribonema minus TaxID=303371 RepID=A0A835ZBL9_9STRA|nr:hypothetical protein JKP88DRAFT_252850 [Tribonema minus]